MPASTAPSCLLVVDVQTQFINEHTRHLPAAIQALLPRFDWVFASRLLPDPASPIARWKGYLPAAATDPASALAIDLGQRAAARTTLVEKTGFGLVTPAVGAQLQSLGVTTAHIVGVDTDLCVLRTAGDLLALNIRPVVLTDLVASTAGEPLHSSALLILKRMLGRAQLTTSATLPA
ncbi:cysteine hydrolase family protein [Actomonas aquatica]|uniref:Isochorismatase family protein n=1 Tax=Actomonas aquatica TaxID=2866162 RepID=A0ABZ1C5G1_9BACT|nr:isochorismatase family protein [Opitutus sp. WL0086]WRQ86968.1 isochorismatase family protein [Opitutus sp. WL0086]